MISLRAILLLVGATSATPNYEDRCTKDKYPLDNYSATLPDPTPGGPSSYDKNMQYFRSNDNGVCTPFRLLSDWDDTLQDSGDNYKERIAGGDTSTCESCQYPNFDKVFNLVTCAASTDDNLLSYDRYLTLLTARPDSWSSNWLADGSKQNWSGAKGALPQMQSAAKVLNSLEAVPKNAPQWIDPKVKNCGWFSCSEETRALISVLPGSGGLVSIEKANSSLNCAGSDYLDKEKELKDKGEIVSVNYPYLRPRVEMQLLSMERQYYLRDVGLKKGDNFRAYAPKFPEVKGSFVFFGDDGQADMTVAAVQLLGEQDGTHQLAFAAIHATVPKAHLSDTNFIGWTDEADFPYSDVSREMMQRTMNRRFPPLEEFGHKPRFFYFTDYTDLQKQLVKAGWVHGGDSSQIVGARPDEAFLQELINSSADETEEEIRTSLGELHDMPNYGLSSYWTFAWSFNTYLKKPLTKLAQLSRKQYCDGTGNQPKQAYKHSLLAQHIIQELGVYGAQWDYCLDGNTDCKPALNLEEFCAVATKEELSKKYPRVDTSAGFIFPGASSL